MKRRFTIKSLLDKSMPYTALQLRNYQIADTDLVLDDIGKKYTLRIRDLPTEEKPREKLVKHGTDVLSVGELLAIIFSVGTRKEDVLAMSNRVLKEYGGKAIIHEKDPKKLSSALDIPLSKACQLVACFELGRRFFKQSMLGKPDFLRTAKQVYEYLKDMRTLPKEHLRGLYLDSHFRLVHDEVISIGSLSANLVHPREVFKPALETTAAAVILAHNHPSGIARSSEADILITKQLVEAGKILGIHVLDHVIITRNAFSSVPVEYFS